MTEAATQLTAKSRWGSIVESGYELDIDDQPSGSVPKSVRLAADYAQPSNDPSILLKYAATRFSNASLILEDMAATYRSTYNAPIQIEFRDSTDELKNSPILRRLSYLPEFTLYHSNLRFENGSDIEPLPVIPTTGRFDIDARLLIWRVRNVDAAIKLVRITISEEIADRLAVSRNHPCDANAGEEPLKLGSIQWFIDYYLRRGKEDRPLIGMTPDGIVEANWYASNGRQLTIRFFADGKVWVAVRDVGSSGSCEMLARDLLSDRSLMHLPDWT